MDNNAVQRPRFPAVRARSGLALGGLTVLLLAVALGLPGRTAAERAEDRLRPANAEVMVISRGSLEGTLAPSG